jgi:hypothetical protein
MSNTELYDELACSCDNRREGILEDPLRIVTVEPERPLTTLRELTAFRDGPMADALENADLVRVLKGAIDRNKLWVNCITPNSAGGITSQIHGHEPITLAPSDNCTVGTFIVSSNVAARGLHAIIQERKKREFMQQAFLRNTSGRDCSYAKLERHLILFQDSTACHCRRILARDKALSDILWLTYGFSSAFEGLTINQWWQEACGNDAQCMDPSELDLWTIGWLTPHARDVRESLYRDYNEQLHNVSLLN